MLKTFAGGSETGLASLEKKLTGSVPDDSQIPKTVRRGVRFMLAGAATTLVVGLFLIIATLIDKNALTDSNGKITTSAIVASLVEDLILVTIWVVVARYNRAGAPWARILASVFCAISTYQTYALVNDLTGVKTITVAQIIYIVGTLLIWALGVLSIAMVWRSESNPYYRARSAAR